MALREEELQPVREAEIVAFPARRRAAVRARVRRRRGGLAVVGLVVVVAFLLGGGPGGNAVASKAGAPRSVVIQPGETLWDLASRHAPADLDPRAYVDALEELNGLDGAVPAGALLRLPR